MRIEQLHLFFYGVLLFASVWAAAPVIPSTRIKLHLRALSLALGLGFIVVPGHGEFITAPILAAFTPPLRSYQIALGGVFFAIWWIAAFNILKLLARHKKNHSDG